MRHLRALALAQIALFAAWAGWEEWKVLHVTTIILETMPVDPRDLLSGQFLALRYRIAGLSSTTGFPSPAPPRAQSIGVLLKPSGTREIGGKKWPIWEAKECRIPPPPIPSWRDTTTGVWVIGTLSNHAVDYGIERFYFSEDSVKELGTLRSGHILVEAFVGRNGKLAIRRLIH